MTDPGPPPPEHQPPTAASQSPTAMEIENEETPIIEKDLQGSAKIASSDEKTGIAYVANSNTPCNPIQAQLEHFHRQIRRLEALERRVESRTIAARRRMVSILDNTKVTRDTHLRLYLSHSYTPEITPAGAMAALMSNTAESATVKPSPACWTMHIEGKLLVDHLDHEGAAAYDKRTKWAPPKDDLDRSRGEEEEAPDMRPLKITHLFDMVKVTFQTVYAPFAENQSKKHKAAAASPKKKSSRRASGKGSPATLPDPGPESDERILSLKHQVVWKLKNDEDGSITTPDADLWSFKYYEPAPPVQHKEKWRSVSVTASIELYRRTRSYVTAVSTLYQQPVQQHQVEHTPVRYRIVSPHLQKALFPHHGPETTDLLTGIKRGGEHDNNNDKNPNDDANATDSSHHRNDHNDHEHEPPKHNEVHIPATLTMSEIANAFFTYIRDRKLVQTQDVVSADDLLQNLLGMEQFSFSQLQQLLLQQGLVVEAAASAAVAAATTNTTTNTEPEKPVQITYILDQDSASVLGQPFPEPTPEDENPPDLSLLQLDIDIVVPSLFGFRARELLRRVKRRELEYTSSRPKARYSLPTPSTTTTTTTAASSSGTDPRREAAAAKEEEERRVRQLIERAASQQELAAGDGDLIPIQLALAKAAPHQTEARRALALDAALSHLLGELERRRLPAATRAWQVVEACEKMVEAGAAGRSNHEEEENEDTVVVASERAD